MLCSLIVVRKPENLTSRRELDVIPAQKDTVGLRVLRGGDFEVRGFWGQNVQASESPRDHKSGTTKAETEIA